MEQSNLFGNSIIDTMHNQLDFLKLEKQFWEEQMAAEEEGSEAWQAAKEQWLDATNSLNDAIASSIENLQAKYSNAISAIFDNLNNKITGGKGLDYINEEWTLINKNADMYLDKVNSIEMISLPTTIRFINKR